MSDLVFGMLDFNGDGVLSREEFARAARPLELPDHLTAAAVAANPALVSQAVPDPRELFPGVRVPRQPTQALAFRSARRPLAPQSADAEQVIQEQLQLLEEQLRIEAARQREEVRKALLEQQLNREQQAVDRCFSRLDADGDGVLTREEFFNGLQQEIEAPEETKTLSAELDRLRELNRELTKEKAELEAQQAAAKSQWHEEDMSRRAEMDLLRLAREEAMQGQQSVQEALSLSRSRAAATRQRNLNYMDKQTASQDGKLVAKAYRLWREAVVAANARMRRKNEAMSRAMRLMSNNSKRLRADCFAAIRAHVAEVKRLREAEEVETRLTAASEQMMSLEAAASQDANSFHAREQAFRQREKDLERKQERLKNDRLRAWETHFLGRDRTKCTAALVQWHGLVAKRKQIMERKRLNMATAMQHISQSSKGLAAALFARWKHYHVQQKHSAEVEEAQRSLQAAKSAAGKATLVLQRQFAGSQNQMTRLVLDGWLAVASHAQSCREKKESNIALIEYKIRQANLALLQVCLLALAQHAGNGGAEKRLQEAQAHMDETAAALEAERYERGAAMQRQKDKHMAFYKKLHSSQDSGLAGECFIAWKQEREEAVKRKKGKDRAFGKAQRAIAGTGQMLIAQSFGAWKGDVLEARKKNKVKDKAFLQAQRMIAGSSQALLSQSFSAWQGITEAARKEKRDKDKAFRLAERAIADNGKVLLAQSLQAWTLTAANEKKERLRQTQAQLRMTQEDLQKSSEASKIQAQRYRAENLRAHAAILDSIQSESLRPPLLAWRSVKELSSQRHSKKEHNMRIAERAINKNSKVLLSQSFTSWSQLARDARGGKELERWRRRHSRESKKKLFLTDCINVQSNRLLISNCFAGWAVVAENMAAARRAEAMGPQAPDFFDIADANHDGVVTREELRNAIELLAPPPDVVFQHRNVPALNVIEDRVASEAQRLRQLRTACTRQAEEVGRLRLLVALGTDWRRCHRCDVGLTNLQTLMKALRLVGSSVCDAAVGGPRRDVNSAAESVLSDVSAALLEAAPLDPRLAELSSYLQAPFA